MTRCEEFYTKWEKEPNWCEHCKSAVSEISNYIRTVSALEQKGIDKKFAIANLSEGAARPLLREKDTIVQDQAFEELTKQLQLQQERQALGHKPDKITHQQVNKIVSTARGKKPREKKTVEPPNEKIPLASAIQWLEENTVVYFGANLNDINIFIKDFEREMRHRHMGR